MLLEAMQLAFIFEQPGVRSRDHQGYSETQKANALAPVKTETPGAYAFKDSKTLIRQNIDDRRGEAMRFRS